MMSTWLIIHMVKNKITKILIKIQSWHSRLDESAILDLCYLGIRSSCSITHRHLSVKYFDLVVTRLLRFPGRILASSDSMLVFQERSAPFLGRGVGAWTKGFLPRHKQEVTTSL